MGLFDLFKGKKKEGVDADARAAAKWAERAGDKRAQAYDRQEALQALAAMGTSDAAAALLKRFTFSTDPSITDHDEKQIAFEGILKAGEKAIEPVRHFAAKAESLAWPMKILKEIMPEDAYIEELVSWLSKWDTEYAKFIDPKLQLLAALEDHKHASIVDAVTRFLDDASEPARFHAVVTLVAQDEPAVVDSIVRAFVSEESLRIKNRILDGFVAKGWRIPESDREPFRKALPYGTTVDAEGAVHKRD